MDDGPCKMCYFTVSIFKHLHLFNVLLSMEKHPIVLLHKGSHPHAGIVLALFLGDEQITQGHIAVDSHCATSPLACQPSIVQLQSDEAQQPQQDAAGVIGVVRTEPCLPPLCDVIPISPVPEAMCKVDGQNVRLELGKLFKSLLTPCKRSVERPVCR